MFITIHFCNFLWLGAPCNWSEAFTPDQTIGDDQPDMPDEQPVAMIQRGGHVGTVEVDNMIYHACEYNY